jgi:hypothetical protein
VRFSEPAEPSASEISGGRMMCGLGRNVTQFKN